MMYKNHGAWNSNTDFYSFWWNGVKQRTIALNQIGIACRLSFLSQRLKKEVYWELKPESQDRKLVFPSSIDTIWPCGLAETWFGKK